MTSNRAEKLSRRTKLFYGAGDFGFALTDTVIGVLFAIFLTDVVGLKPGQAAGAIFLGMTWDYINDPLMGYLTDRTRTRWGRRRPFLLFGFLPFAIAFALLWWKPPIESTMGLIAYYALAYLFYDAAATFVYMPYFALTPELTLDYDERTSLTSYRMAFSIFAGLVAFTIPLMMIGSMRPENADKVLQMGILFGLASGLPLLITFFGTRERAEHQVQEQPKIKESLLAAMKNRPFVFSMGIFLFTWSAITLVQSMLLFFLKYRMGMERESDYVLGTVFIIALLTLPFWEWASRRLDKRKAYIWGMLFLTGVLLTLTFISPSATLPLVLLLAGLAGIGVAAVHVLPWSMIPDAVEYDQMITGQRHEGMFYSLVTLFRKIASSIALPLALLVLERGGYVSNAVNQSPSAIRAILALTGPIPGVLLLGGIVFAIYYPISREEHAQLRVQLAERQAEP